MARWNRFNRIPIGPLQHIATAPRFAFGAHWFLCADFFKFPTQTGTRCGNFGFLTLLGVWYGGACAAIKNEDFEKALAEIQLYKYQSGVGSLWIEMLVQG